MSYTRIYIKLCSLFLALIFSGIALTQTCLGLYGTDAGHPNGLFLQLVAAKKYTRPPAEFCPRLTYRRLRMAPRSFRTPSRGCITSLRFR